MPTLFVGLGSHHGDDRIGWLLADELARQASPAFQVRKAVSAIDLFDWLDGCNRLVVADACQGAGAPGQWFHWVWPDPDLLRLRRRGSHDLGLAEVLETAEQLGRLPERVEIFGIEILDPAPGERLSPQLLAAWPQLLGALRLAIGPL